MIKEKLGSITLNEKDEILGLLERKWALQELMDALDSQPFSDKEKKDLQIRIVSDIEKNQTDYEKWMSDMLQKYHGETGNRGQLKIDFNTSEIFLI